MNLSFPTLLGILLTGLGVALLLSAIRPFATTLGTLCLLVGVGLWLTNLVRGRVRRNK